MQVEEEFEEGDIDENKTKNVLVNKPPKETEEEKM